MNRTSITIVGESGSGLLSVGKILCEGLKNMGYYLNADREYPSLIKGGQSTFTINFSDQPIHALEEKTDILLSLDKKSVIKYFDQLKENGTWIHGYERPFGIKEVIAKSQEKNATVLHLPIIETAHEMGGTSLMKNVVLIGMAWKAFGFPYDIIEQEVKDKFGKRPKLLPVNLKCLKAGYDGVDSVSEKLNIPAVSVPPDKGARGLILIDGNHAVALGAIHAGVRAYYAYPMSPSSSILTHMANYAESTGMVVKQAEDEITVANLTLGSYFTGTRSMCATSGGGFDLMTETVSLAGIIESPWVCCVVQRPGPATGLPTWTAQGDLNLAIHSGHGEYGKIVLAMSDPVDAFDLTQHAHNLAEKYQVPVILLSEKVVAETFKTVEPFGQKKIPIERGLVDPRIEKSQEKLQRFEITESGVSPRWIPCIDEEHYYFANGDEHDETGRLTEEADIAGAMYDKRVRKNETIKAALSEPLILGEEKADISFVGWGSAKNVMLDVIEMMKEKGISVNYFHYEYLWPLKTDSFEKFLGKNSNVHLIEGNNTGQLGALLESHTKYEGKELFSGKYLKWDGRPFWVEEVREYIEKNS